MPDNQSLHSSFSEGMNNIIPEDVVIGMCTENENNIDNQNTFWTTKLLKMQKFCLC